MTRTLMIIGTAYLLLIVTVGCSSGPKLRKPPCHAIANRQDEWACGGEVLKQCRPVADYEELVCRP